MHGKIVDLFFRNLIDVKLKHFTWRPPHIDCIYNYYFLWPFITKDDVKQYFPYSQASINDASIGWNFIVLLKISYHRRAEPIITKKNISAS